MKADENSPEVTSVGQPPQLSRCMAHVPCRTLAIFTARSFASPATALGSYYTADKEKKKSRNPIIMLTDRDLLVLYS